jgi:hypothetical protein
MLHVFITVEHFRRCHEAALFGVRPSSLNQLAQVRDGDAAYLYARKAGLLFGPYGCVGPVRYLGPEVATPVWEWAAPGSRREKYRFVVALAAPPVVKRFPIAAFYDAARRAGVPLAPADFIKRSVFSFLPAEGARVAEALGAAPGQRDLPFLAPARPRPVDAYPPVDGAHLSEILAAERFDESWLEFLLAREEGELAREMAAAPAFNQLRIDDRGDRVDLVYASPGNIYIIELKTGRRDAEARRDILRYELWGRGNRRRLAAALGMADARPTVTPVLVAAGGPPRPADCRIYDWRLATSPARLLFERVM